MVIKDKRRINYLDGIRGVAALLVVFGHFRNAFFDYGANSYLSRNCWSVFNHFFLSAEFCVEVFFVLSGFILTYNSIHRPSFLAKQWGKRFYRLFVPVFISSLLYFIFIHNNLIFFKELSTIHSTIWISKHWTSGYSFMGFLTGCFYNLMILSDARFVLNINSALWTIPVEFYWSYCLFLCLWVLKFIKTTFLQNLLVSVAVLSVIHFAIFKGAMYGLLFLGGALLAINFSVLVSFFTGKRKYYLFIFTLVIIYCVDQKLLPEIRHLSFRWSYLVAILCVFCAMVIIKIQQLFLAKFIQWLGRISFALYLLHMLVIASVGSWLYISLPFLRTDAGLFLLLIIILMICLGAAWLFTKYIDEPLMNLFDVFYKWVKKDGHNLKKGNYRDVTVCVE